MQDVKAKVRQFIKDYGLTGAVTISDAKRIIGELGYKIMYYQKGNAETEAFLKKFGKLEYAKTRPAFTYRDDVQKFVFLMTFQSKRDELILLTHEIGHIYLGHLNGSNVVSDTDVQKEDAANTFSSLLREYRGHRGVKRKITFSETLPLAIALVVCCGLIIWFSVWRAGNDIQPQQDNDLVPLESITPVPTSQITVTPSDDATYTEQPTADPDTPANADKQVVVTATGKKYHLPDCHYVSGRDKTRTMSIQEAKDSGLTPCLICKPDND